PTWPQPPMIAIETFGVGFSVSEAGYGAPVGLSRERMQMRHDGWSCVWGIPEKHHLPTADVQGRRTNTICPSAWAVGGPFATRRAVHARRQRMRIVSAPPSVATSKSPPRTPALTN